MTADRAANRHEGRDAGHYPGFNVLDERHAWDETTRAVVLSRVEEPPPLRFLTAHEAATLEAVARHILYEHEPHLLAYVVAEADRHLSGPYGEGQRQPGVPPAPHLVRGGLEALDEVARGRANVPFREADVPVQFDIVKTLQHGALEPVPQWQRVPQKALFKKLVGLLVKAYYSHPDVWSRIGYAGPAFPRGYYRLELGVTDPWEARRRDDGS